MDEVSLTRPAQPSTKAIVADEAFCAQVSALLLCEQKSIHNAFIGEPAEEVLEMVRWALSREDDEGFDAAGVLTAWARKRGRGAWSGRPRHPKQQEHNRNGKLARTLADFWAAHPEELAVILDRVEASLNGRT